MAKKQKKAMASRTNWGDVQTRSEEEGLKFFPSIDAAMEHARNEPSVWKVSFSWKNEKVRLVRRGDNRWQFEPIELPYFAVKVERKMLQKWKGDKKCATKSI